MLTEFPVHKEINCLSLLFRRGLIRISSSCFEYAKRRRDKSRKFCSWCSKAQWNGRIVRSTRRRRTRRWNRYEIYTFMHVFALLKCSKSLSLPTLFRSLFWKQFCFISIKLRHSGISCMHNLICYKCFAIFIYGKHFCFIFFIIISW